MLYTIRFLTGSFQDCTSQKKSVQFDGVPYNVNNLTEHVNEPRTIRAAYGVSDFREHRLLRAF